MRRLLSVLGVVTLLIPSSSSYANFESKTLYSLYLSNENRTYIEKGDLNYILNLNTHKYSIEAISKVSVVHILDSYTEVSADPEVAKQWALTTLDYNKLYSLNARGAGVTLAVLDTGVDKNHSEFTGRILPGYDVYNPNGDGSNDNNGHGTHVAGIIGAAHNGKGIEGLAPESLIMPVKVLDATGYGDDADVGKGVIWAVDHGANIINMSLGGTDPNQVLAEAIVYSQSKGVAVIVAAGNSGSASGVIYPAADPGAIGVGATSGNNKSVFFSSQGDWVDVSAPGVSILSTWPNNSYQIESGTSMATPYVSAAIAVLSSYLGIDALRASNLLLNTATDIPVNTTLDGKDTLTGNGLIDPFWALTNTAPRALVDRTALNPDQVPDLITMPSLELPKLVTPTLPPMPVPSLPKVTLPKPNLTPLPAFTSPTTLNPNPISPTVKPVAKTSTPKPKTKTGGNKITFVFYHSLQNTIITVYSKGEILPNRYVTVYYNNTSIKTKSNFSGRIVLSQIAEVTRIK